MDDFLKIIVSFLLGSLSAVFAEPLRRWFFRARIRVDFDKTPGSGLNYLAITPAIVDNQKSLAIYARAQHVTNTSKATAKQCRAYLCQIDFVGSQGLQTLHHDPLPLKWSYVGVVPIDLPQGMSCHVDVVSVNNIHNRLVPQTDAQPVIWSEVLQATGRYRFTFMIAGDNFAPVTRSFEMDWPGLFQDVKEDCFHP